MHLNYCQVVREIIHDIASCPTGVCANPWFLARSANPPLVVGLLLLHDTLVPVFATPVEPQRAGLRECMGAAEGGVEAGQAGGHGLRSFDQSSQPQSVQRRERLMQ